MEGENPATTRAVPLSLPPAPVFRPTVAEFEDPLRYIASIRPIAEPFGICKIIPPEGWDPPFAIDKDHFRFPTRIQRVHELQDRSQSTQAQKAFMADYQKFLKSQKKFFRKQPVFNGVEVDLLKLYKVVEKRGGCKKVSDDKKWKLVAKIMQIPDGSVNTSYGLRLLYQKHLLPYEEHCRARASPAKPAGAKKASVEDDMGEAIEAAEILGTMMSVDFSQPSQDEGSPEPPAKKRKSLGTNSKSPIKGKGKTKRKEEEDEEASMRVPENIDVLVCELCSGGYHEDKIILCDRCDRGFHMFCLSPPLQSVPEGEWICPLCLNQDNDKFAFGRGSEVSFREFEKIASQFKKSYWKGDSRAKKVTWEQLEARFWNIVEEGEEIVEVLYGADLDTGKFGSGFPRQGQSSDTYALCKWNVNNFPKLDGDHASMLRYIDDNIPGVMVPWLYVGMMFSSFCWHVEDHLFYSINYHHFGEPKRWYSVPYHEAKRFETAFKGFMAEQFEAQPDLLFQLVTMLSPRVLQREQVEVYTLVQEERNFVVTFPGAYHAGFNHGLNCAEAVNFCPGDWWRYSAACQHRYQEFRKHPVISQEGLLFDVCQRDMSSETAQWACRELSRVLQYEKKWRYSLWSTGLKRSKRVTSAHGVKEEDTDDVECATCHAYLHSSAIECGCCPGRYACLEHSDTLCECHASKWCLLYRYSLADIEAVLDTVTARVGDAKVVTDDLWYVGDPQAKVSEEGEGESVVDKVSNRNGVALVVDQVGSADDKAMDSSIPVDGGPPLVPEGATASPAASDDCQPPKNEGDLDGSTREASEEAEAAAVLTAVASGEVFEQDPEQGSQSVAGDGTLADGGEGDKLDVAGNGGNDAEEGTALDRYHEESRKWQKSAAALLKQGHARLLDLENLLMNAQQYVWGGKDMDPVRELEAKLQAAKAWHNDVITCCRAPQALSHVQRLLAWDPPPVHSPGLQRLQVDFNQAQAWQERYQQVTSTTSRLPLEQLKKLVAEGAELNLRLPELSALQEKLDKVQAVMQQTEAIFGSGQGSRQHAVGEVKELLAEVASLDLDLPMIDQLAVAVEAAEVLQDRAKSLLSSSSGLEALTSFLAEASSVPLHIPEVVVVKERVEKVVSWMDQANEALEKGSLAAMRKLLATGDDLGVELELAETLRHGIKVRECEDSCRRLLQGNKGALGALTVALEEAEGLAVASDLVKELKLRVENARSWEARANSLLIATKHRQEGTHDLDPAPDLDLLQQLVAEGGKLGVRMEQLGQAQQLLKQCQGWVAAADELLSKLPQKWLHLGGDHNRDGTDEAEELSSPVTFSLVADDSSPPKSGEGESVTLEQVEGTLVKGQALGVVLPFTAELQSLVDAGKGFEQKADQVLRSTPKRCDLDMMQELVQQGTQVGLAFPQLKALRDGIRALLWQDRVRDVFQVVFDLHEREELLASMECGSGKVNEEEGEEDNDDDDDEEEEEEEESQGQGTAKEQQGEMSVDAAQQEDKRVGDPHGPSSQLDGSAGKVSSAVVQLPGEADTQLDQHENPADYVENDVAANMEVPMLKEDLKIEGAIATAECAALLISEGEVALEGNEKLPVPAGTQRAQEVADQPVTASAEGVDAMEVERPQEPAASSEVAEMVKGEAVLNTVGTVVGDKGRDEVLQDMAKDKENGEDGGPSEVPPTKGHHIGDEQTSIVRAQGGAGTCCEVHQASVVPPPGDAPAAGNPRREVDQVNVRQVTDEAPGDIGVKDGSLPTGEGAPKTEPGEGGLVGDLPPPTTPPCATPGVALAAGEGPDSSMHSMEVEVGTGESAGGLSQDARRASVVKVEVPSSKGGLSKAVSALQQGGAQVLQPGPTPVITQVALGGTSPVAAHAPAGAAPPEAVHVADVAPSDFNILDFFGSILLAQPGDNLLGMPSAGPLPNLRGPPTDEVVAELDVGLLLRDDEEMQVTPEAPAAEMSINQEQPQEQRNDGKEEAAGQGEEEPQDQGVEGRSSGGPELQDLTRPHQEDLAGTDQAAVIAGTEALLKNEGATPAYKGETAAGGEVVVPTGADRVFVGSPEVGVSLAAGTATAEVEQPREGSVAEADKVPCGQSQEEPGDQSRGVSDEAATGEVEADLVPNTIAAVEGMDVNRSDSAQIVGSVQVVPTANDRLMAGDMTKGFGGINPDALDSDQATGAIRVVGPGPDSDPSQPAFAACAMEAHGANLALGEAGEVAEAVGNVEGSSMKQDASVSEPLSSSKRGKRGHDAAGPHRPKKKPKASSPLVAPVVPEHKKVSLLHAAEMLRASKKLPVDEGVREVLQSAVDKTLAWQAKVQPLVPDSIDGDAVVTTRVEKEEVEALRQEGLRLPFHLTVLRQLDHLLTSHAKWEERVRTVLEGSSDPGNRPTLAYLHDLQEQGGDLVIQSNLWNGLEAVLERVELWQERCRKLLLKRASLHFRELDECLGALNQSLSGALNSIKTVTVSVKAKDPPKEVKAEAASTSRKRRRSSGPSKEPPQSMACFCQTSDGKAPMVGCDSCGDWYHQRCVGLTSSQAKSMRRWQCPICQAVKGDGSTLDAAVQRLQRTSRPSPEVLMDLLADARRLEVVVPEEGQLTSALAQYRAWVHSVDHLVASHEATRLVSKASSSEGPKPDEGFPMTEGAMRQIIQQGCALEVLADDVVERILRLIRVESWRGKMNSLLRGGKPSAEQVARLVKEGETLTLDLTREQLGSTLLEMQQASRQWVEEARELGDKLKALAADEGANKEELEVIRQKALQHVELAGDLPTRVDREREKLAEAARLYCLCHQLYDEARPMLSCDYCSDWFHYDCVGMDPPEDDQDDEEVAPEDFRCPRCCAKVGIMYNHVERIPLHLRHSMASPSPPPNLMIPDSLVTTKVSAQPSKKSPEASAIGCPAPSARGYPEVAMEPLAAFLKSQSPTSAAALQLAQQKLAGSCSISTTPLQPLSKTPDPQVKDQEANGAPVDVTLLTSELTPAPRAKSQDDPTSSQPSLTPPHRTHSSATVRSVSTSRSQGQEANQVLPDKEAPPAQQIGATPSGILSSTASVSSQDKQSQKSAAPTQAAPCMASGPLAGAQPPPAAHHIQLPGLAVLHPPYAMLAGGAGLSTGMYPSLPYGAVPLQLFPALPGAAAGFPPALVMAPGTAVPPLMACHPPLPMAPPGVPIALPSVVQPQQGAPTGSAAEAIKGGREAAGAGVNNEGKN